VISFLMAVLLAPSGCFAQDSDPKKTPEAPDSKVHYKSEKDLSFDELLIQGQLRRPEITVVTGNAEQGTNGLLRLRENFLDRIANDIGEDVQ
jgi:hypothetical protein